MLDDVFNLYWDKKDRFCITEKKRRTRDILLYMLNRTQQMFTWKGLPDTLPQYHLETLIQTHGNGCITEVLEVPEGRGKPGLYGFFGGLGGMQDAYYEPTIYTVANPYLEFTKELLIGTDCVRVRNDRFGVGLIPLCIKYAALLNENEISLNICAINYRISNLISADDDRTYNSAVDFIDGIIDGKLGAISSSEFFDGIRNDKGQDTNRITDLIEYEQYLKGSWFNEIGLDANYNMKRERLNQGETDLNNDCLMPLVDQMLAWREKAVDDIKELYGDRYDLDDLSVALNPLWDNDKQYVDIIPQETRDGETPEEDPEESGEDPEEDPEEPEEEQEPEEEEQKEEETDDDTEKD